MGSAPDSSERYQVWIVAVGDWRPGALGDVPPRATVLELAEHDLLSAGEALAYLLGFNQMMLDHSQRFWAIRARCAPLTGAVEPRLLGPVDSA